MTTFVPNCGDGIVVGDDICDDGEVHCLSDCINSEDGWHCSVDGAVPTTTTCVEQCGDGYITDSEACEDGNSVAGDGCNNCALETGWTHTIGTSPNPSTFSTYCGT